MKKFPFLLLITSLSIFSQIPTYYNDVNLDLTGNSLMSELATKITATHTTTLSYGWDDIRESDLNPTNSSEVILFYGWNDNDGDVTTDRTRSSYENGGNVGNWNREHVYPKSLGTPNLGTTGPGADVHHLRAADVQRNGTRSSNLFADGSGSASYITSSGGFYPGDEWKGDVARMMMYMYLRYGSQCLPSNVAIGTTVSSDSNMVELLLEWNAEDPVSTIEQQRNDVVANAQGNRNPFIDNPAFATAIWGGVQAEDLFGNTSNDNDGSSDNSNDSDTSNNNGTATDLFISEYIEGSSYNKAIEIANFTGSSVNLSSYSLYKTSNGNGTWANEYTLSGTLANGDVIVIAHSSASGITADINTNTVTNFNGNDAVALYKNGSLIDLVGTPNSSANFGQNTTLRRISSITGPNASYTTSEWYSYPSDTFSDIGTHTFEGASSNSGNDNDNVDDNTTPIVLDYCDAAGQNANYEYIDYIAIGGISNTTGSNGGYADFTSQTGNLSYGTNTIIVSAGFASSAYTEYWKVWIDFNQNGTFDSDEEVVSGSSSSSANLSYSFTVPTSANSGNTKMRVAMKWDATPTSCETFSYGEVEDYTVTIGNTAKGISFETVIADEALGNEAPLFDANLYPNPAVSTVNIALKDLRDATYSIYNTIGQVVLKGNTNRTINVSNLHNGIYTIEINDGQRSFTKKLIKK